MKKIFTIIILTVSMALLISCSQHTKEHGEHSDHDHSKEMTIKEVMPQSKCPITGNKIDSQSFTDYKGSRVYYCCQKCDKKFLSEPQKYLSEMSRAGVTPAKLQTTCPVTGDGISEDDFEVKTLKGTILVCCKKCVKKLKADPEKYFSQMQKQNIIIGKVAKVQSDSDHKKHDHSGHKH